MTVKVLSTEDQDVAVLSCEGELNGLLMNDGEIANLTEQLGADWAKKQVVLDMSEASYMDSAAVGWLLSLQRAFKQSGGGLVVCGVQPEIRRVVELMRIDKVIKIVAERDQAIELFKQGGENDA